MSECHDIYEPMERMPEAQVAAPGTQCHDSYPSEAFSGSAPTTPAHECRLQTSRHGRVCVIEVVGRLDWATEDKFADLMRVECRQPVIIDLSATTSDGAGTGVLLAATQRATKAGQQVIIVVVDPLELEVLQSVGLDVGLPIVASQTLALEWIEAHVAADLAGVTATRA